MSPGRSLIPVVMAGVWDDTAGERCFLGSENGVYHKIRILSNVAILDVATYSHIS